MYNSNRLYALLSSNPVFIKSGTSPDGNWALDGGILAQDIDYQTSTTEFKGQIHVNVNCPVRSARWSIESVDGTVVQPFVDVDTAIILSDDFFSTLNQFFTLAVNLPVSFSNDFLVETDQLELGDSETYRIVFNALDYCGNRHIIRSDGVQITTVGLEPGLVKDGCNTDQDLNYQRSTSELTGQWVGFGDGSPEQQVAYYEVAIGSDREFPSTRSDIVPFTSAGLNTTYIFKDLDLISGVVYFFTVRAHAVSGASIDVTSNGISVGFDQKIIPGQISLARYQADRTTLYAHWAEFQSDLPIRLYEVAFGSSQLTEEDLEELCEDTNSNYSTEFDVFGFVNYNLDTYVTVRDLDLSHNTTYFVVLRVLDQAKKCLAVISDEGLTIDTSPPLFDDSSSLIEVGTAASLDVEASPDRPVYVAAMERIEVSWESFIDRESEIDEYKAAIFSQTLCGDNSAPLILVKDFVSVDDEREVSFDGVNLTLDVSYVVAVRATNNVGLSSIAYSLPFVVDSLEFFPGSVKDGSSWEYDVVFQSDLSMLSATFSHAKLSPLTPGVTMNGPCPNTALYTLAELDPEWSVIESANLIGPATTGLVFSTSQVSRFSSVDLSGVAITARRDEAAQLIQGGAYQTRAAISNGGTVSLDILAAQGRMDFESNAITSVLFIDSGAQTDVIATFEPESSFEYPASIPFNSLGLQIYRESTSNGVNEPQRVVLWTRSGDPINEPKHVSHDLPHLNLTEVHTYTLDFKFEQVHSAQTRHVELFIDGVLEAVLFDLPAFTDDARIVLHISNKQGYIPPPPNAFEVLQVQAVFGNVSLPVRAGHICDYGSPFFSHRSPIVEFRAAVGTQPGQDDVVEFQVSEWVSIQ